MTFFESMEKELREESAKEYIKALQKEYANEVKE